MNANKNEVNQSSWNTATVLFTEKFIPLNPYI